MRKDTQIGIMLGVVILVIIGVFFSTRPSLKETKIPNLTLSEEGASDIEEIDIDELAKESKTRKTEVAVVKEDFIEERKIKKEFGKKPPVEVSVKEDVAVIEGRWEGVEAEIEVAEKDMPETSIPAKEIEESAEDVTISKKEEEQQIPSADVPPREIIHKVVSSDNLIELSKKYYGDGTKWRKIHEANKDKIPNPDVLYTGLELLIPEITVSEKRNDDIAYGSLPERESDEEVFTTTTTTGTHTISPGDTLYSIARKYYGDSAMWIKIHDANEDNIEDKRLLEVGQTLVIPE
jgi:nucleoid-associated protein YgaU